MFILEIVDNDVCEVSLGYICYLYLPVRDPLIISPSTQILDQWVFVNTKCLPRRNLIACVEEVRLKKAQYFKRPQTFTAKIQLSGMLVITFTICTL